MDLTQITFATIVGILTVVVGVLVKVIGFPDQFIKNYKRKSTKHLSTIFYVLAFISYILWTIHGIFKKDWVLIIGQGFGIIIIGMILMQIIIYRNNK